MKKRFALLLALVMVLSLAACGGGDDKTPSSAEDKTPASSQQQETPSSDVSQPDNKDNETTAPDTQQSGEEEQADTPVPTSGLPLDWPDNDYTKLVPAPDCGGKVLTSGEIGELFAIELKWDIEQGLTYAQLLEDAGFGDDCVEKYEQYGYIDRTANGVNVQLLDVFGAASLSIMPVETEDAPAPDEGGSENLHELFDIEQLADIPEFPDYAKKAIGDLRWCDDLGADRQFKYVYNAYMKEVTQEDFETYVANLTANAPTNSEEGNIFGFYWEWGQITGEYFPDSGTLDVILTAK